MTHLSHAPIHLNFPPPFPLYLASISQLLIFFFFIFIFRSSEPRKLFFVRLFFHIFCFLGIRVEAKRWKVEGRRLFFHWRQGKLFKFTRFASILVSSRKFLPLMICAPAFSRLILSFCPNLTSLSFTQFSSSFSPAVIF